MTTHKDSSIQKKTVSKTWFSFPFLAAFIGLTGVSLAGDFNYDGFHKLYSDGNYQEALDFANEYYSQDAPTNKKLSETLNGVVNCMNRTRRIHEIDAFLENLVSKFPEDSRALNAIAQTYTNGLTTGGYRVDNQFKRGSNRSGGQYMLCGERDRVRSLQLLVQAEKCLDKSDFSDLEKANFYLQFAQSFSNRRGGNSAWQMQALTDISQLPDYQSPENYSRRYYGSPVSNAPVDEEGNPVFQTLPESFESATSDGQRWRYLLSQAEKIAQSAKSDSKLEQVRKAAINVRADFALSQFGVQTIAGININPGNDSGDDKMSSIFKLETLSDNETIARLATGIKRFTLPEDYSYIALYEQTENWRSLANIYLNRRQYVKSAQYWKKQMDADAGDQYAKEMYAQIVIPWGRFTGRLEQDGLQATFPFIFRNAKLASFTASSIKVEDLLSDAKNALRWNPKNVNHSQLNLQNLAYRLVIENQTKYIDKQVLQWSEALEPEENHFDKQIDVKASFPAAGAYLIQVTIAGGNTQYAVVWINNTVLAKKIIDGKYWYYVADSQTGQPVPYASVDFFGYKDRWVQNKRQITVKEFSKPADENGQLSTTPQEQETEHQWLIVAKSGQDRLAFLGFNYFWWDGSAFKNSYDNQYNAVRVFSMTDRPVYRPNQKVMYKFWARRSQYDADGSDFANKTAELRLRNPRGEEILKKEIAFDNYGGFTSEYELPADAMLGQYNITVTNSSVSLYGNCSFRVEEYKKPEFMVEIAAPDKPVALGETVKAKVSAKYYFGQPVSQAKAKIKVTRSEYNDRWFPPMRWDWLFGRGYWWFAYEYNWYPGWGEWGCCCPFPSWYNFPHNPPEVVYEQEVDLKEDGTFEVEIDTQTALAIFGKQNQKYDISAEVTDASRRTITGSGKVLVASEPFTVYAWLDRGVYQTGDSARASFKAQTLDNKPVTGVGTFKLYAISYDSALNPVEKTVFEKSINPEADGNIEIPFDLPQAGQFRAEYTVDDGANHVRSGAQIFTVRGKNFNSNSYRFSHLEIIPDKDVCNPGDTVKLTINTDKSNAAVWLFPRASNGICLAPQRVNMDGKTGYFELKIEKRDMPNFFVEAVTVADNKVYSETRQICVPPEKRILSMEVIPTQENYKPGEDAKVKIVLKDLQGKPFVGQTVVTVYDKSLEYISGGSNVGNIAEFFWTWKRSHRPQTDDSLITWLNIQNPKNAIPMSNLGIFGAYMQQDFIDGNSADKQLVGFSGVKRKSRMALSANKADMSVMECEEAPMMMAATPMAAPPAANGVTLAGAADKPMSDMGFDAFEKKAESALAGEAAGGGKNPLVAPTVRTNFADSAFWTAALETNQNGEAEISLKMPENLTTWKIKAWAMGSATQVGEAETEVITRKNLILRAQTPRFLVQTDQIVLSAIVHNYLDSEKSVQIKVETGDNLATADAVSKTVAIPSKGETRVDWLFTAKSEGEAAVKMFALTDEESDAMEVKFPIVIHGIMKQDSFSGAISPQKAEPGKADGKQNIASQTIEFTVPDQRKEEQSRLEVRYSPTLAGAMLDAVPYLVDYPYGCTEQTLNRFLPAAITQKVVRDMGVDISTLEQKYTNLNAQEIGAAQERAKQWNKTKCNPVFNPIEMDKIVKDGVERISNMQCADGGWGWFSGSGEYSFPHTTAVVVHGLFTARASDVRVSDEVFNRGVDWLQRYESEQITLLENALIEKKPEGLRWKSSADNLDALIYDILAECGKHNPKMGEFLYRDRTKLSPYALALIGLAYDKTEQVEKRDMVIRNLSQFLRQDDENQTAYLELGCPYWYWYGSEIEAQAWYLKLLCRTNQTELASRLVKYLLNNRKHATYWNSTRDTALVLESFAEYLKKTGEMSPDMTVEVILDGKTVKTVKINAENLFAFDGSYILEGVNLTGGKHTLELKRTGNGPLYFNAYVSYFTLEDFIPASGLEIKVQRKYYKLVRDESAQENAVGKRGQVVAVKTDKYIRQELSSGDTIQSGDTILVDLTLESKNDYEYLVFEDRKPAGFEPLDVRSGYNGNEIGAYVEFRDQKVSFFCRTLPRGKCSVSYKLKAELPGVVSALPASGEAMYAPELKANSSEFKIKTTDK